MEGFELRRDFLMGTATAALQIEGTATTGTAGANWARLRTAPHCLWANDHYNRVEEDIAPDVPCTTTPTAWPWNGARIEPAPYQWEPEGLDHYRRELELLRTPASRPWLPSNFSHPLWFETGGMGTAGPRKSSALHSAPWWRIWGT